MLRICYTIITNKKENHLYHLYFSFVFGLFVYPPIRLNTLRKRKNSIISAAIKIETFQLFQRNRINLLEIQLQYRSKNNGKIKIRPTRNNLIWFGKFCCSLSLRFSHFIHLFSEQTYSFIITARIDLNFLLCSRNKQAKIKL